MLSSVLPVGVVSSNSIILPVATLSSPSTLRLPVTVTLSNVLVPVGAATFALTSASAAVVLSTTFVAPSFVYTSPLNQALLPSEPFSSTTVSSNALMFAFRNALLPLLSPVLRISLALSSA